MSTSCGSGDHTGPRAAHLRAGMKIVAVLDIGSAKIACLIAGILPPDPWHADDSNAAPRLQILGIGYQLAQGIRNGVIADMALAEQAVRGAVDKAEHMAGVAIEDVILSVSCGRLSSENFTASLDLHDENIAERHIGRVLSAGWEHAGKSGRAILHAIPQGFALDGDERVDNPRAMVADRLCAHIHAVTADEAPLRNLLLCVERCHLRPQMLVAAPYASALSTMWPEEMDAGGACIDMGAGTTTLSLFQEGRFVYCDAIIVGGNHLTQDIATALATPKAYAERLKTLHGTVAPAHSDEFEQLTVPLVRADGDQPAYQISKAQLASVVRPRIDQIFSLISERLDASGRTTLASCAIFYYVSSGAICVRKCWLPRPMPAPCRP